MCIGEYLRGDEIAVELRLELIDDAPPSDVVASVVANPLKGL
jgi:hypothetical protein